MICGVNDAVILCRSYDKDAKWLELAVASWQKHNVDNIPILIVGMPGESVEVQRICCRFGLDFSYDAPGRKIKDGYLAQQHSKLGADLFTEAEHVLYMDSDLFATGDFTLETFMRDGKPLILHTSWDKVGDAKCWRDTVVKALGTMPPYEFMRRIPLMYLTDTVRWCREWIETLHGMDLADYLNSVRSFSEFNVLGAYAHLRDRDSYTWVNTDTGDFEPLPFKQFWSWGDMNKQLEEYGWKRR